MAWRDSRKNWSRLLLFVSSIILGIAALVAINSFGDNILTDLDKEASNLLGADLMIESDRAFPDSIETELSALSEVKSVCYSTSTMAYIPSRRQTRFITLKIADEQFPIYGSLKTVPQEASKNYQKGQYALVDKNMMAQFELNQGDTIRIASRTFEIAGALEFAPGRTEAMAAFAPLVFVPNKSLESSDFVKNAQRLRHERYLKLPDPNEADTLASQLTVQFEQNDFNIQSIEDLKDDLGNVFEVILYFLNIVSFVALLLGCIGVASAVHIYLKEKAKTVAILRCLGTSGWQAFQIFMVQILTMGLLGAIIGAILGTVVQLMIPFILQDFLPFNEVTLSISWSAIFFGITVGLSISLLFALIPLLQTRQVSPLLTLRASYETKGKKFDGIKWLVYLAIVLFIAGFTYYQANYRFDVAGIFSAAILLGFLLLVGMSQLLIFIVKRFFPRSWSYIWRQSLANLFRPNNQTSTLMVTIGLGTGLISLIVLTQSLLMQEIMVNTKSLRANLLITSIQDKQIDSLTDTIKKLDIPIIEYIALLPLNIAQIKGQAKEDLPDSTSNRYLGLYDRTFQVTFKDTIDRSDKTIEGTWPPEEQRDSLIAVSVNQNLANRMKVELGDAITFSKLGKKYEAYVAHIRRRDNQQLSLPATFIFENNAFPDLNRAYTLGCQAGATGPGGELRRILVDQYPNTNVLDLTQLLAGVKQIFDKVSFVIQFMALFSIFTGIIVLISSILLSKYQRIQESVLLRTLGASRKQILWINALEYLFLGTLAALTGILLAIISTSLLAAFAFQVPYTPNWTPVIISYVAIVGLAVTLGLLNSREVLYKPPLEVLRKEV